MRNLDKKPLPRDWHDISKLNDSEVTKDEVLISVLRNDITTLLGTLELACKKIEEAGGKKYHGSALVYEFLNPTSQP